MDCSLPGVSVCGILQARILEWVAVSCSRESSHPRNQIQVSCIAGRFFTDWATREAHINLWSIINPQYHLIVCVHIAPLFFLELFVYIYIFYHIWFNLPLVDGLLGCSPLFAAVLMLNEYPCPYWGVYMFSSGAVCWLDSMKSKVFIRRGGQVFQLFVLKSNFKSVNNSKSTGPPCSCHSASTVNLEPRCVISALPPNIILK